MSVTIDKVLGCKRHDMNTLTIEEKLGKHLRKEHLDFMVQQRIREYGENTKDFDKNERESRFFFILEGHEIHAFGMVKPVTISYGAHEYPIMGMPRLLHGGLDRTRFLFCLFQNFPRSSRTSINLLRGALSPVVPCVKARTSS